MIKSILRNSDFYKNVNNIWVIYEYIGNNSFTNEELQLFAWFVQQNNWFWEIFIQTIWDKKKYYIGFFLWEKWYANNVQNLDNKKISERTSIMLNLKPKFERLPIFDWKLKEINLKFYNIDEDDDNIDYIDNITNWMNEKKTHLQILGKYFQEYLDINIWWQDYRDYILQNYYMQNSNLDFFKTDQEIFEPILNFANGNKFFLFPFYIQGENQKTWDNEFQKLDILEVLLFLDQEKTRNFNEYILKISFTWDNNIKKINESSWKTSVIYDWEKSYFDLNSIEDEQNMFFEYTYSLFLINNKPDISGFLNAWIDKFKWESFLVAKKVVKDFNEMYLSHNNFWWLSYIWHTKNLENILSAQKEYLPLNKQGTNIWSEFFSNNPLNINFFDMVKKDEATGELESNANWTISGSSWAWKTHFAKDYVARNETDQIIVFDNMQQFEKLKTEEDLPRMKVLTYWSKFPNFIWTINIENISNKQSLFFQILMWLDSELSWVIKENFRWVVNMYIETIIWKDFLLDNFTEYVKNINQEILTIEERRVLLNKVSWLNTIIKAILNNKNSLFDEVLSEQKIILSYALITKEADKEYANFLKSILLDAIWVYLADKKNIPLDQLAYPYTTVMVDEAHNMFWEKILEDSFSKLIRQVRNFRANVISISQSFDDFYFNLTPNPEWYYNNSNFYILLSPDNREQYIKKKWWIWWKRDIIIDNLKDSLAKIAEKYWEDKKNPNLSAKDKTRFWVFIYQETNSFYILNSRKKLPYKYK